ncbi:MAG: bthL [Chloroflexi bacterium]|jgi:Fe-S-cluster-containing dehydrogenase component|nr:bthL [Chloroflexota bacterium]
MARYGFVIDITRCNGCYNCVLACKDEHFENEYPGYAAAQPMTGQFWMKMTERERGQFPKVKVAYTAIPCMHCENAPCVAAAIDGAVYQRRDGIVIIDPQKAKGQRQIVSSCPYRVIYWNEELALPQKCTLCAHLLDAGWKEPRCSEVCPTRAIKFGDLDDPDSEVARLVASGKTERMHPEFKLKEKVTYLGLPKRFVAGAVVFGDIRECAEGVAVTLKSDNDMKTTQTDNYGDFEFEGLPENVKYFITLESPQYKPVQIAVNTNNDRYLGEIVLERR